MTEGVPSIVWILLWCMAVGHLWWKLNSRYQRMRTERKGTMARKRRTPIQDWLKEQGFPTEPDALVAHARRGGTLVFGTDEDLVARMLHHFYRTTGGPQKGAPPAASALVNLRLERGEEVATSSGIFFQNDRGEFLTTGPVTFDVGGPGSDKTGVHVDSAQGQVIELGDIPPGGSASFEIPVPDGTPPMIAEHISQIMGPSVKVNIHTLGTQEAQAKITKAFQGFQAGVGALLAASAAAAVPIKAISEALNAVQIDPSSVGFVDMPAERMSGTYRLTFNGVQTAPIPENATSAEVQAALEAINAPIDVDGDVPDPVAEVIKPQRRRIEQQEKELVALRAAAVTYGTNARQQKLESIANLARQVQGYSMDLMVQNNHNTRKALNAAKERLGVALNELDAMKDVPMNPASLPTPEVLASRADAPGGFMDILRYIQELDVPEYSNAFVTLGLLVTPGPEVFIIENQTSVRMETDRLEWFLNRRAAMDPLSPEEIMANETQQTVVSEDGTTLDYAADEGLEILTEYDPRTARQGEDGETPQGPRGNAATGLEIEREA